MGHDTVSHLDGNQVEQEHVGQELADLNLMLDASVDCFKVIDCDGSIRKMNRSGCQALGLPPGEIQPGTKWLSLLPVDVRAKGRRALRAAREGRKASFAGRSELPGHKTIHWDNILTPVLDQDGRVTAILCLSRNITRQREAERKLRIASETDILTGLPNRRSFKAHAGRALKSMNRTGKKLGLLLIDVNDFKDINDQFGHDAGDHVLRHVARRFARSVEPGKFVARLGGDEFAIVVSDVRDRGDLDDIISRLRDSLRAPVRYRGRPLSVTVSIGGAMTSHDIATIPMLMKASDVALYGAKAAGRREAASVARADGLATAFAASRAGRAPAYAPVLTP